MIVANHEISITGKLLRIAKLRHEWCDFPEDPQSLIETLRQVLPNADIFTFFHDIYAQQPEYPFCQEAASASVLSITTHKDWLENLDFKVRNKIRKAQKSGVELRVIQLDDDFAHGVEAIYNESPVRQGRKFSHYGKEAPEIKEELGSFLERSIFVGAYFQGELIGFMKLFQGSDILRTVHIIAKINQRDKPVMDALIAKAIEICEEKQIRHLQYGSWANGGLGAFRAKHGFTRVDVPRYFVPLNVRGKFMLKLKLHHPFRDRLPEKWVERLTAMRIHWNSLRYGRAKESAPTRPGLTAEQCK